MKNLITVVVICAIPAFAGAQSGGIAEQNYSVGVAAASSGVIDDYGLFGDARLPVTEYVGMFGSAVVSRIEDKDNTIEATAAMGIIGVLLRNSEYGAFEASYNYGESKQTLSPNVLFVSDEGSVDHEMTAISHGYSLVGRLFIQKMDLSARLTEMSTEVNYGDGDIRDIGDDSIITYNGTFYFGNSFSFSAHFLDYNEFDAAGISATYQPAVFDNAVEITGRFKIQDARELFGLSMVYHFGSKVSLIDRNRRY